MKPIIIIILLVSSAMALAALPSEHFSNLPDVSHVYLSPKGTKLSSVVRIEDDKNKGRGIQVRNLENGKVDFALFIKDSEERFIDWTRWKDETTLLVGVWHLAKTDGISTREHRLLIINTDTFEINTPFKAGFLKRYSIPPSYRNDVIDILRDDPKHILMGISSANGIFQGDPIVIKVNIKKRTNKTIQYPETRYFNWRTDQFGRIRIASHWEDDGTASTMIKDLESEKWSQYWPHKLFSKEETKVLGFGKNPNVVYINTYHGNYKAIFKVDLNDKNGDRKKTLVYSDPNYDVDGHLIYSWASKEVIGIGDTEEGGTKFFKKSLNQLQNGIDKALPDRKNYIYSLTEDENKYLVYSTGHTESGTYYLGQRDPASIKAVAYRYKALSPDVLSPVQDFQYKTRDGLKIDSWLTLPKGAEPRKLPAIIFPHGGPIARQSKAFDYWAQFFASRGYAVLQMNFRGSTGQGYEFMESGLKKWGKEMQDDIEDGALALIKKGIIDKNKLCIVGANYGGYAAQMGIVKTPELYKCAVSVSGISDVFKFVKDNRMFWNTYNVVDEQIGNDNKTLRAISPIRFVEKIKAPILLIHGEFDQSVTVEQSQKMHNVLLNAKKDVSYIELPGEDHYLSKESNRNTVFTAMADFLGEHLPVDSK